MVLNLSSVTKVLKGSSVMALIEDEVQWYEEKFPSINGEVEAVIEPVRKVPVLTRAILGPFEGL